MSERLGEVVDRVRGPDVKICMEKYRSGHNELDSKSG